MNKKIVLILLLSLFIYAQGFCGNNNTFGLSLYSGIGKMAVQHGWSPRRGTPFSPSYSFGFFWMKKLSPNSMIRTQLLLEYVSSTEKSVAQIMDSNTHQVIQEIDFARKKSLYYPSLPILYSHNFKRLTVMAGFNISLNFIAMLEFIPDDFKYPTDTYLQLPESAVRGNKRYGFHRKYWQYGPILALGYRISPKWEIQIRYYHNMNNLLIGWYQTDETWKIRNIQTGISYIF